MCVFQDRKKTKGRGVDFKFWYSWTRNPFCFFTTYAQHSIYICLVNVHLFFFLFFFFSSFFLLLLDIPTQSLTKPPAWAKVRRTFVLLFSSYRHQYHKILKELQRRLDLYI